MDTPISFSSFKTTGLSELMSQYESKMVKNEIFEDVDFYVGCLPEPLPEKISEVTKTTSQVASFLTNITHIVLNILSFNVGEEYLSLWDLNNVVEIYKKMIIFPVSAVALLKLDTKKTILATFSVYTVAIASFSLFLKYKPAPEQLPGSPENISKKVKLGQASQVIGNEEIIDTIIRCVSCKESELVQYPVLYATTGCGKTTIADGVAAKTDLKVYRLDIPGMIGNGYQTFADKIRQIFNTIGEEHICEYLFVVDEVDAALRSSSETNLSKFLHPLISRSDVRCVVTITTEYWEKVKEKDPEFLRRFKSIEIKPAEYPQARAILSHFLYRHASKLLVDDGIYQEIIDQTKDIPSQSQPSIGLEVMREVVACVNEGKISGKLAEEINKKKILHQSLGEEFSQNFSREVGEEKHKLGREISTLETRLSEKQEKVNEVKQLAFKIFNKKEKLKRVAIEINAVLDKKTISEDLQKKYLWLRYHKLPALHKECREKEEILYQDKDIDVPLRINKNLITKVVEDIRKKYQKADSLATTTEND